MKEKRSYASLIAGAAVGGGALIAASFAGTTVYSRPNLLFDRTTQAATTTEPVEPTFQVPADVVHLPTPIPLKSVYMTQCAVGTPSFREYISELLAETELNSVIIDIKDYTGGIAFPSSHPALAPYVSDKCGAKDMKAFIRELNDRGVYVIGRITVFQDPLYASIHPELAVKKESDGSVWKDGKGLSFIDVGARPFWEYIVALSKESHALGFDELNFDYIRYPSDGNMRDIAFPHSGDKEKPVALEEFFQYLHGELEPLGIVTSADLFGMTATTRSDMGIGQVLERALPYFDYIAPMVYPSHYPAGFRGHANVNAASYDIVHYSMSEAVRRARATTTTIPALTHTRIMREVIVPATATTATTTRQEFTGEYQKPAYPASVMRPWLQDFNYPVPYTPEMVGAQIQATYDSGLDSWMFWDPANRYRSLRIFLDSQ